MEGGQGGLPRYQQLQELQNIRPETCHCQSERRLSAGSFSSSADGPPKKDMALKGPESLLAPVQHPDNLCQLSYDRVHA